ncbi:transcription initiation factor TFIID subunit 1, partial [Tubulinosema ratisbonensis]
MEQEIFSTIQRNQNAPICNDDLFTYEYLDSKQEDICFEDGCLVSTDYLTYLTFENVRFELNQPIKSFEYSNNLLALIYADNSGEVFTLEKKTVKKFQDVSQILMHLDKIYTLEKDYTVKEYLFNLEQSICKESLSSTLEAMSISKENKEVPSNETNKVLFQEKKQIFLTIFKNTLFYFKDNNLYNKEQKKITNSVKKIKELKNDKLLVITEQNNKINLKLTNIYFKLQEEVRIEEDSDKIVEVKLFEDYFVIATFYKIYIFKDNLLYLRKIDEILLAGQTYPLDVVYSPNSRKYNIFCKNRLKNMAYRYINDKKNNLG